jgi:hypothetical protein
MAYLGSNDPNGWVICDGSSRSNTNGKYNNLINMSIGSGILNSGNYTPPNYQGAFLRGAGSNGNYTGPSVNASQNHATQTHSHVVTDPGHSHTFHNFADDENNDNNTTGGLNYFGWKSVNIMTKDSVIPRNYSIVNIANTTTGITINNSTTSVDQNETRPYNYGVNWIIKL